MQENLKWEGETITRCFTSKNVAVCEPLNYISKEKYMEGVKLSFSGNTVIPSDCEYAVNLVFNILLVTVQIDNILSSKV